MTSCIRLGSNVSLKYPAEITLDKIDVNFLNECKKTEIRLESNCKNSIQDLISYLNFLCDLNRFEDAYNEAVRLVGFFPVYEKEILSYVVFLDDEDKILKHLKTLNLAPDASQPGYVNRYTLLI